MPGSFNTLVVLGPTASGKTRLATRLAHALGGAIISADSRQVYRGLDIGSGKDLSEYIVDGNTIPYHLIDIADLESEYNVFQFQRDCFDAWEAIRACDALPLIAGGTGLYLEAALRPTRMIEVPQDPEFRAWLNTLDDEDIADELKSAKPDLHNITDLIDRGRMTRALEIARYESAHTPEPAPDIQPLVLGTDWPREVLRARIAARLRERLDHGMIEEVEALHESGVSWERLDRLGLEYRFIAQYLRDEIKSRNDLFQKLNAAIAQFAKRQRTWFRRMERNGTPIHWIPQADFDAALRIIQEQT